MPSKTRAERDKLPRLAEAYAQRTLLAAKAPETVTVPLQALQIGDLAVCAIPFETFCEIGLDLKKRSPFPRAMVIGLANGTNGYLPTPEQHELGGYETWLGTNRVQEDASVILIKNLLEMLQRIEEERCPEPMNPSAGKPGHVCILLFLSLAFVDAPRQLASRRRVEKLRRAVDLSAERRLE